MIVQPIIAINGHTSLPYRPENVTSENTIT